MSSCCYFCVYVHAFSDFRLWSHHPWRHLKVLGMWSWAASSRWPCLGREFGPGDLQRSLLTSAILWLQIILVSSEYPGALYSLFVCPGKHSCIPTVWKGCQVAGCLWADCPMAVKVTGRFWWCWWELIKIWKEKEKREYSVETLLLSCVCPLVTCFFLKIREKVGAALLIYIQVVPLCCLLTKPVFTTEMLYVLF